VLGGDAGDHHDFIHNYNVLLDINVHHHFEHDDIYDKHGTHGYHHHHGPGDNDILIHNHSAPNGHHFHKLTPHLDYFGPADHDH
jgi:hypothetical protein